jgi:alkaline phosphatase
MRCARSAAAALAGLALLLAAERGAAQSSAGNAKPPQRGDRWFVQGQNAIQDRLEKLQRKRENRAKNVILFVADGHGITSNMATRLFAGQYDRAPSGVSATLAGEDGGMVGADSSYGEEHIVPAEDMPNFALSKTYNTNAQTPDSAGTASALNTGVKTKSGVISVREGLKRGFCTDVGAPIDYTDADLGATMTDTNLTETFAETVKKAYGKKIGVVTTARLTHATPACVYSHSADRNWESSSQSVSAAQREAIEHYDDQELDLGCANIQKDIATQLVDALLGEGPSAPTRTVDIALGGGREMFLPELLQGDELHNGSRVDGANLIERFRRGGGNYAWSTSCSEGTPSAGCLGLNEAIDDALEGITPQTPAKPVLGLFEPSHMMYEYERRVTSEDEPNLRSLTQQAIRYLEKASDVDEDSDGYFLMVEGGRVDHANHGGNIYRTVTDALAYQEAVKYAMEHTSDEDTLVISTADHSHGLEFQAYCGRGSKVNGLCYDVDGAGEAHSPEPLHADDGQPFSTMGFMNGAGSLLKVGGSNELIGGKRRVLTEEMAMSSDYQQEAILPKGSESHSGTDVGIYAKGPWAHLFDGTMEQNAIYHVMAFAVSPGHCSPYTLTNPDGSTPKSVVECARAGGPAAEWVTHPEPCTYASGNREVGDACDCDGNVYDACGVCGGSATVDPTTRKPVLDANSCDCVGHVLDSEGVCGGYGRDVCGVAGGPGIAPGKCDCDGNVQDCTGVVRHTHT